jgi:hypothetical protein
MPLLPIDLQTMFGQMGLVGKEQAVQKDTAPQYQFAQATQIVKKTEEADNAVNQPRELGKGLEKVKEKEQRRRRRSAADKQEPGSKEGQAAEGRQVLSDPDLGHHVDMVG